MKWIVSGVLSAVSLIVFLVIWQQRPDEETAVDAPASEASSIPPARVPELKAEVETEAERHVAVPETEPFAIIKIQAEVATESEAGTNAFPEAGAFTIINVETATEAGTELETEPDVEPDTKSDAEQDTGTVAGIQAESEIEAIKIEAQTAIEAIQVRAEAEIKAVRIKAQAEIEAVSHTLAEPKTEPEMVLEAEADPEPEAQTEDEAVPETASEIKSEVEAEAESTPEAAPETIPDLKADSRIKVKVESERDTKPAAKVEVKTMRDKEIPAALLKAEKKADPRALKVLRVGRKMTLDDKEIVQGGCWNYADAVYARAGYPTGKRKAVFKGGKDKGPYADAALIQPGDWLYYINHSYRGIEHSAIFIAWTDYDKQQGLMLSYGGESRQEPARYSVYDLTNVYNITRPKKAKKQ